MSQDTLTLIPEYRFEWTNGDVRVTSDDDCFEERPHPDAVENLAALGRQDPDCTVTLLGMGG